MIIIKKTTLASALTAIVFAAGSSASVASEANFSLSTIAASSQAAVAVSQSGSGSLSIEELNRRAAELDRRESALNARGSSTGGDLLPPSAAPGECYARVWVDAEYRQVAEQVLAAEESTDVRIIPAQYETVSETILVSGASSRLETIPAVYGTESETVLVRDGERRWRIDLGNSSPYASQALLDTAKQYGIDVASASPGQCFHEHYVPATYRTVSEQVLKRAASESVAVIPARYEQVQETILVREASTKLITVPAEYGTETEQVLDKPAHTVWKRGTGPIQRLDESTGEIMCLVEVPATYKTISRRVVRTPASTRTIEIPAEYKTVSVRKQVSAASEQRTPIEAVYGSTSRQVLDQDASYVWHEVSNKDHPAETRTGKKICLTETQPQYNTVSRQIVKSAAQTRSIEIPAQYDTVQVTKLVSPASEQVSIIPAEYKTVTRRELVRDGYMSWRSILCETNMTTTRISDIQRALINEGHDVGSNGADGVIGEGTIRAINAFQAANNLPVDRYINIETLKALGVSHN